MVSLSGAFVSAAVATAMLPVVWDSWDVQVRVQLEDDRFMCTDYSYLDLRLLNLGDGFNENASLRRERALRPVTPWLGQRWMTSTSAEVSSLRSAITRSRQQAARAETRARRMGMVGVVGMIVGA